MSHISQVNWSFKEVFQDIINNLKVLQHFLVEKEQFPFFLKNRSCFRQRLKKKEHLELLRKIKIHSVQICKLTEPVL